MIPGMLSLVSSNSNFTWRFGFYFNEINYLVSSLDVESQDVSRSTNGSVDSLAKQVVGRSLDPMVITINFCFLWFSLFFGVALGYNSCIPGFSLSSRWGVVSSFLYLASVFSIMLPF